ncbi:MAG: 3-oxoacyl-ACP reductase FabG [Chloroflexi bacterium]|nr:3-oxoacyl-ACP reductase FabG [Chloroflexota bacterium]
MRLEHQVALVTGGGRGIGRSIALALAGEGARVVVNYRTSAQPAEETVKEIIALGSSALAVAGDISQPADVERLVQSTLEHFGRLDILVNNAGVYSGKKLSDLSEETWQQVIDLNLKGVYLMCRAAARAMLEQRSGVIINISSGGGLGPDPGYQPSAAYAASKAGVVMLTKVLARELGPHIRVNCSARGHADAKPDRPFSPASRERISKLAPLGRVGTPEDIADVAVFLASDASRYMTGQTLSVDGGIIMLP